MGKLKKQTKASRARRLQMMAPLGGTEAVVDDEETPFALPVVVDAAPQQTDLRVPGQTELIGPKKVSSTTGETQGAMKTRQAKEGKRVRTEINQLRQQRRKIRKSEPDGAKRRKELADRIKWLQVQYQQRVQAERATLKDQVYPTVKEARRAERQEDETRALRTELAEVKKQMAQLQSLLTQKLKQDNKAQQ